MVGTRFGHEASRSSKSADKVATKSGWPSITGSSSSGAKGRRRLHGRETGRLSQVLLPSAGSNVIEHGGPRSATLPPAWDRGGLEPNCRVSNLSPSITTNTTSVLKISQFVLFLLGKSNNVCMDGAGINGRTELPSGSGLVNVGMHRGMMRCDLHFRAAAAAAAVAAVLQNVGLHMFRRLPRPHACGNNECRTL